MPRHLFAIAFALLLAQGCGKHATAPGGAYTFSFENGMEGRIPAAADTGSPGGAHAPWSIVPTTELAFDGETSLRY